MFDKDIKKIFNLMNKFTSILGYHFRDKYIDIVINFSVKNFNKWSHIINKSWLNLNDVKDKLISY